MMGTCLSDYKTGMCTDPKKTTRFPKYIGNTPYQVSTWIKFHLIDKQRDSTGRHQ